MSEIAKLESAKSKVKRFYALGPAAKAHFWKGDFEKARALSEELLDVANQFCNDWNYGNAIHSSNLVLGLLAIENDDIELAIQHLHAAGATSGSPQLDTFGPNMTLSEKNLGSGATRRGH